MKRRKFKHVDVFTAAPLCGNPAAVVLDDQGLSSEEMQAIAREMNLSETVFVLPPTNRSSGYLARIFTPRSELPFAGHPTIATAHAVIEQHFKAARRAFFVRNAASASYPSRSRIRTAAFSSWSPMRSLDGKLWI